MSGRADLLLGEAADLFAEAGHGDVADELHADIVDLVGGTRHLYESEMKERRRSAGRPHHEAGPPG